MRMPVSKHCTPELHHLATKAITKMANRYSNILREGSLYSKEDLVQEGWILWYKIYSTCRFTPSKGSILNVLNAALVRRYSSILRYDGMPRRLLPGTRTQIEKACSLHGNDLQSNPEKAAMFLQLLCAFAEMNSEFAKVFVEGLPSAMLKEFDDPSKIHGKQVRDFFKIKLDKIKKLANMYL